MVLNIILDEQSYSIDVPQYILAEAHEFFDKMDSDMDRGWQMSREWVERPDTINRCRIAADKLLTAMHTGKQETLMLMAGYILSRLPGVTSVRIDTHGDMLETEMLMGDGAPGSF
ncbi:MAG: hypothetical protein KGJ12_07455 [Gammaproteobacteria bacterium]|nr:hypothetical protein [Gammaproteobacteria bacterium]